MNPPAPFSPFAHLRVVVLLGAALAVGLLGLLLDPLVAKSQAGSTPETALPTFVGLRVGFVGQYKLGHWTPVEVTLRGGMQTVSGRVQLTVPDGDDLPTQIGPLGDAPVEVPAGRDTVVRLFAKIGREPSQIACQFTSADSGIVQRSFSSERDADAVSLPKPLASEELLWATLGAELSMPLKGSEKDAVVQVHLPDAQSLPTQWLGYDGVDVLMLAANKPETFAGLTASDPRLTALDTWVRLGGNLILCVGTHGEQTLTPGLPLARFVPGEYAGVETLDLAEELESFSRPPARIPPAGRGNSLALRVSRLNQVRGEVLAKQGDLPLIVRASHGFGQVVFVAFDFDRPPISNWVGRNSVLLRLLSGRQVNAEGAEQTGAKLDAHLGKADIVSQLRGGLDDFPGVRVVPFWTVGGLIFVYLLLIGPGDFFFVKRVLRKMSLTWITFPTTVVLVSLGAYWLATASKGDQLRINQVDVIDIDAESRLVRGTTWTNVFSPGTTTYDFSLRPQSASQSTFSSREMVFSWLGLPGDGWGGMRVKAGRGLGLAPEPYRYSPALDQLLGVPIDIWTTKSFVGRWQGEARQSVTGRLHTAFNRTLRGTLTNELDFPLSECLLACDRWAYPIGDLPAGASFELKSGSHRDLEEVLKDYRQVINVKNQSKLMRATPYDGTIYDVPRDVRLMMFHEAVDAQDYTGLAHRYHSFLDMSRLLSLKRAVLIGRAPSDRALQLHRNGQTLSGADDRHWVYYRFLLPVADKADAAN